MIFLSFVEYFCRGTESAEANAEGGFTVACEAASSAEVLEKVLPAKIKEIADGVGVGSLYIEFYVRSVVELPAKLEAPVALGAYEGSLSPEEHEFRDVFLPADEKLVKLIKADKVTGDTPFATVGTPPKDLEAK